MHSCSCRGKQSIKTGFIEHETVLFYKKIKKVDRNYQSCNYMMVPEAGLEPAWILLRRILNPVRIPISPLGQKW